MAEIRNREKQLEEALDKLLGWFHGKDFTFLGNNPMYSQESLRQDVLMARALIIKCNDCKDTGITLDNGERTFCDCSVKCNDCNDTGRIWDNGDKTHCGCPAGKTQQ